MEFESLSAFLAWLGTGAGAVVAFSFLVEYIPAWHTLEEGSKKFLGAAGSALIALLAFLGLQYIPADVIASVDPYFKIIVGALAMYFSGQLFHAYTKK